MKVQGVLFDLDGTLVDHEGAVDDALRDFLPAVGVPVDESSLDAVFEGYLRAYEDSWRAFGDVPGALADLAELGLATAVLTNGTTAQQNAKLRRTGLAGQVGPVWTVEDLGVAKPDPEAFRLACERWGLPPSAVLSVGDRPDLDLVPARAAGLAAVLIDRRAAGPDRITSLRELGRVVAAADASGPTGSISVGVAMRSVVPAE